MKLIKNVITATNLSGKLLTTHKFYFIFFYIINIGIKKKLYVHCA